jgi:hypothetical protein
LGKAKTKAATKTQNHKGEKTKTNSTTKAPKHQVYFPPAVEDSPWRTAPKSKNI